MTRRGLLKLRCELCLDPAVVSVDGRPLCQRHDAEEWMLRLLAARAPWVVVDQALVAAEIARSAKATRSRRRPAPGSRRAANASE